MRTAAKALEARDVLSEVFGYSDYRAGQREAIDSLVAGRDTVVVLPTGAGKSLCYQVPAIVASRSGEGTTIVISPLIALMKDQVSALRGRGIAAAAINSHQDDIERREVVSCFLRGELELLYVSPERAALASFKKMLGRVPIALLAIDEAHCVSQWGHDFRPEYMRLNELREVIDAPTAALTATATPQVIDEIAAHLELREPTIVRGDFARPNLTFSVRHVRTDAARISHIIEALDAAGMRSRGGGGRAIVYCATRKKTETVAAALKAAAFPAGYYHAGRTQLARERSQRAFELGRARVLVATNAFGMGIDFPDVRVIVHFGAPGSLEAYYQEAGRAGRDGAAASCLLLFGPADLVTQRRLQSGKGRSIALEERAETALARVEHYAGAVTCRQQIMCAHFTGSEVHPECGQCDVCTDPEAVHLGLEAPDDRKPPPDIQPLRDGAGQIIIDAVGHLRRPVGKSNLAKALRGSRAKVLRRGGLLRLPQYAALSEYNEPSITAAIDELLASGTLARMGRKYPTVWLPDKPVRQPKAAGAPDAAVVSRAKPRSGRLRHTDLARELENYRKRIARQLKWKAYMVFQRRVISAVDTQRPRSRDALARIHGLGPAKIERFGDDILDIVRRFRKD